KPDPPLPAKPLLPESFAGVPAEMKTGKTCMHCHHVWSYGEQERPRPFAWTSPEIPLPEKVGLTLDVDQGNLVTAVQPDSPASRAGIQPKDRIVAMNGTAVYSGADLSWVVNLLPKGQSIKVELLRGKSRSDATLVPGK
ncbi:MAG TPA: PDZ domain-containing protein, partial [Planctomycetota bacterium]|nr:PDZ domain-containing protein [Planctomycetota bacterium]